MTLFYIVLADNNFSFPSICPFRIFTLYSKSLPLDLACRVWDVFCRDGEEFLFRTALGLLRLYQDVLTSMDFIHMAQFLTRLPDLIPADQLFQHIAAIHMTSRNRKWAQVGFFFLDTVSENIVYPHHCIFVLKTFFSLLLPPLRSCRRWRSRRDRERGCPVLKRWAEIRT